MRNISGEDKNLQVPKENLSWREKDQRQLQRVGIKSCPGHALN